MAHKTTNNIFIKCCLFSRYNYAELLQRPNMLVILQATSVLAITRPILGLTLTGAVNSVQIRSRRICPRSPQSLTYVSSWGFAASPRDSASPLRGQRKRCSKRSRLLSRNSNYLEHKYATSRQARFTQRQIIQQSTEYHTADCDHDRNFKQFRQEGDVSVVQGVHCQQ